MIGICGVLRGGCAAQHAQHYGRTDELRFTTTQRNKLPNELIQEDVRTQLVSYTGEIPIFFLAQQITWTGPDDGGIRRGDREDTGDNQATPNQLGYEPTDPSTEDQASENNAKGDGDYYDGME